MVKNYNGITDWEKDLIKGKSGFPKIFTSELEKVWLSDHPILFIGQIKDIKSSDQENYWIEIEKSLFSSLRPPSSAVIFFPELKLMLQCPKQKIDLLLKKHPNLSNYIDFSNNIAWIAKIDKIETKIILGSGEEREDTEVKIGKGKCIDLLYIGGAPYSSDNKEGLK